jgi:hypothetical protein
MMCSSPNYFSAILLTAFLTISSPSAAARQTGAEAMNPAEKWVLTQVTPGKEADLSTKFPEEKDRKLNARFLEILLTGATLHRHGVRIKGAIITEPIDLENAQIPCEVRLDQCRFDTDVSFAHANITGGLLFSRSTFRKVADFRGMKVGGDASFDFAVFEGHVDFRGADIAGDFQAQWAKFREGGDFSHIKVRGDDLRFDGALFGGEMCISTTRRLHATSQWNRQSFWARKPVPYSGA